MKRTLHIDCEPGPDVMDLQDALNALSAYGGQSTSFPLVVDGYFGPKTRLRVIEFQRACGIVADGTVNFLTWERIQHLLSQIPGLFIVRPLGGGGSGGGGKEGKGKESEGKLAGGKEAGGKEGGGKGSGAKIGHFAGELGPKTWGKPNPGSKPVVQGKSYPGASFGGKHMPGGYSGGKDPKSSYEPSGGGSKTGGENYPGGKPQAYVKAPPGGFGWVSALKGIDRYRLTHYKSGSSSSGKDSGGKEGSDGSGGKGKGKG